MNKKRFFISYSRNDIAIAQSISRIVEHKSFKSFANFNLLSSDSSLANQIVSVIKNSDIIFFVVSKASLNSQWCRREVEFAIHDGKTIVPILSEITEDNVKTSWLYDYVKGADWINWADCGENKLIEYLDQYQKSQSFVKDLPSQHRGTTQAYAPKKSKKGYKIGCICSILALTIIAFFGGMFWVGSPNSISTEDRNICYAPNPSSVGSTPNNRDTIERTTIDSLSSNSSIDDYEYNESEQAPSCEDPELNVSDTGNGINLGIIALTLLLGTSMSLFFIYKCRRIPIKLVANEGCEVYADNHKIATITANIVESIKLKRGKYFISFKPLDKSVGCKSLSYSVSKSNDLINITLDKQKDYSNRKSIKCFIAGSTRLEPERDALRSAIAQTHNQWAGKNVEILSYTYEDFERKIVEGGHQQLYDDFITNDATIAVFIISGEVGEFTISEFEKALDAYKAGKHPQILVFNNEFAEYHIQAEALKKKVSEEKQYWVDYDSLKTLKLQFMSTLNWLLIDRYYNQA